MNQGDKQPSPPLLVFLYEMVIAFFEAARHSLDPVLQAVGGHDALGCLDGGEPAPPDEVSRKFAALPPDTRTRHLGACLTATTNLGLAYVHSFRLLSFLVQGKDALPRNATKPNLAKLYDALPSALRDELSQIYEQVESHDLELTIGTEPSRSDSQDDDQDFTKGFRSQLAYWHSRGLMHDSHLSLAAASNLTVTRFFIPLRSVLILDRILAEHIAPKIGHRYQQMDAQLSSRLEDPKLEWKEGLIHVSLPDKLGRTVEAKWKPAVTSIVRIRESGAEPWSAGFETPLSNCSFVDLKPETEYEIQVTHKNDAGEGPPVTSTVKTEPETPREPILE